MKKPIRKLTLSRETLRQLDADAMRWAAGGATETGTPPECIENTQVTGGTGAGGGGTSPTNFTNCTISGNPGCGPPASRLPPC